MPLAMCAEPGWIVVDEDFRAVGNPVGIGPVISGRMHDTHVYYVDVAYKEGWTRRIAWVKKGRAGDRTAKMKAHLGRISLTTRARSVCKPVLVHDAASFSGLVDILTGRKVLPHISV